MIAMIVLLYCWYFTRTVNLCMLFMHHFTVRVVRNKHNYFCDKLYHSMKVRVTCDIHANRPSDLTFVSIDALALKMIKSSLAQKNNQARECKK